MDKIHSEDLVLLNLHILSATLMIKPSIHRTGVSWQSFSKGDGILVGVVEKI